MKFSVTKEKLLECLQQVQNVVSTRTTLPILSNVLLQANGNEISLTTTDLDVGVCGSFEADVEKGGATTLPAVVHCQGSTSFMLSAVAGLIPQATPILSNAVSLHPVEELVQLLIIQHCFQFQSFLVREFTL
jgi:hypothetical protein